MVFEELTARLNDAGYKNWVKAGHCLRTLQEGLRPYTDSEMRSFHRDVLKQDPLLRQSCRGSCSLKGDQVSSLCRECLGWQRVILHHHRCPEVKVNWENCSPQAWRLEHWELAKAFMPRGLLRVKGAEQCDASALLNLINFCTRFHSVETRAVREVIQCRNELMHSCELRVDEAWMRRYQRALGRLLQQLGHVAALAEAGRQIKEILTADWSICVTGLLHLKGFVEPDSGSRWETNGESISRWEAELLQERLQELLHDDGAQGAEQLPRLKDLLRANRDLEERFCAELQALSAREAAGAVG